MKKILLLSLFLQGLVSPYALSQGWTANIDLDFNHELYAYEKITNASFTYSGVTVTGSSETSTLNLRVQGTGPITGVMDLIIDGVAWEPYQEGDPYSEPISAGYSGDYSSLCSRGFFENDGETPSEHIYIWITIYPRLVITDFRNNCEEVTLSTNTCSPLYSWDVSESLSGPYQVIPGKSSASISISPDELKNLGFADPFGRKYFRVTGWAGTTSQIQAMDIFYPPSTANISATPPKCHDGSDGSIRVDITSANAVINDFVITLFSDASLRNTVDQQAVNDAFTIAFSGLHAGNYWVKIENNTHQAVYGNCWTVYAVDPLANPSSVTIASFEVPDYNGYPIKCKGGNEGTINAKPAGGTGIYAGYEWTPSVSTTNFAQNLSEGTYKVRVKDSNNCWSEIFPKTLAAPEKLSLELTSVGGKNNFDVSCADKTDGKIETKASGGVLQYSYLWSTGATTPALNDAGPGMYEINVTDGNGCGAKESLTLMAPEPIDFTLAEIAGINCPGDHSGILEVQAPVNMIGQLYYSWSSGESAGEITDKSSGNYSVTVSDDQGCSTTRNHMLTEPLPWSVRMIAVADYNGSPIRCNGEDNGTLAMIVTDDGNNTVVAQNYTWYRNGNVWASGAIYSSLDGLSAGVYKGQVTYRDFCKAETTFVLNEPSPVVASVSTLSSYNGMAISCHGAADGSILAVAAGGTGDSYTFVWDTGNTEPGLMNIPAGPYSVTVRDVNGCEGKADKILQEPEPVEVAISVLSDFHGQPISCWDASDARLKASAAGGASFFSYTWNTGDNGPDLTDLGAGTYTASATDINGCKGDIATTLINPERVRALISENSDYNGFGVSCNGSRDGYLRCEGSGGTGTYAFSWAGNSGSDAMFENLPAGVYSVMLEDQNGCSATATGVITEPAVLSLEISATKDVSCNSGSDGQITLSASGGADGYEYSVDEMNWQNASIVTGLKAGSHTVKVVDHNNCMNTATQVLTEPSALAISFSDIATALCGEPTGRVTASATGGTGIHTYRWTDSENNILSNEPYLSGLPSGVFTLTVSDEHSCNIQKSIGITSPDGPNVRIDDIVPASCSYSADGSAELTVTDGEGPFIFRWQDGQTTEDAKNLKMGDHFVEVTDTNGCTAVEKVSVPAPDSLQIELVEKVEPVCYGGDGRLTIAASGGSGNYHYEWENFSGGERVDVCAGTYNVKVTDEKQCLSSRTFVIEQPEPVVVSLKQSQSPLCHDICDGMLEVYSSGGTGDLQYRWPGGETSASIAGLCAGSYTVIVSDANSCTAEETFVLENPPQDSVNLGGSITLCAGQSHTLDPGPQWAQYSWSGNTGFSSSSQRVTIDQAGIYWVDVISAKGCLAQDTFLLETTTDLLKANFLLTTQAMVWDTVVMIDISWPLPEDIIWNFPENMKRLEDFDDIVYGQFENPGVYDVSLAATLGQCRDQITKTVTVIRRDENPNEGRLGNEPFVKAFNLYPNPNEGVFDVVVEFQEESPVVFSAWNLMTAVKFEQVEDEGQKSYLKHFDLRPLSAGNYTLRLDYAKGTKYIRFIVR